MNNITIQKPVRDVQDFLLSTYFADGIRITIGVLFPSLILAQFGMLKFGMTLSLGALCASIVDTPGPIVHRRNAMLITTGLIFLMSLLIGLINANAYLTAILLVVFSLVFSMFNVYGTRSAAIGTAALLILVLSIDDVRPWNEVTLHAGLVLAGGLWYTLLSYFSYRIRPFRIVQQTLSESILEVADFLRSKAKFYRQNTNYDDNYAELLQLQVLVHEKQDAVRELLFKTREIVRDSTPEGRFLLLVFVDMVDLFEQVMSTYYNYKQLHEQFDAVGILAKYEIVILKIADALDELSFALKTGGNPPSLKQLGREVKKLKNRITALERNNTQGQYNTLGIIALKNIEVNIENIVARVKTIQGYFNKSEKKNLKTREIETEKFITRQSIDIKLILENLTFSSSVFRHSLRVAIVMLIGFVLSRSLAFSHSYWILLTILVISKPGFSLTKERNYQRLIGTIVGAVIGMVVLTFIDDKNMLFGILLVCMIGCYSFQRKNYVVSVLFMTPYILILFDFLGMGGLSVAKERIYDTLIGSGIAFAASYVLFPNWEHEKIKEAMIAVVKANANYFKEVTRLYFDRSDITTSYKLARKEVYVTSANLASLFQRMFSEPKSKQVMIKELHQFTALNHLLSSYIATLSLYYKEHAMHTYDVEELRSIADNTNYLINLAAENLLHKSDILSNVPLVKTKVDEKLDTESELIAEQFSSIQKLSYDVYKLTDQIRLQE